MKIVVWFSNDYDRAEEFYCPCNWTKEEITEEVNRRYNNDWYSYDIW